MIAVGAFMQETNDFSSLPTTRATFEQRGVRRGADIQAGAVATPELDAYLHAIPTWQLDDLSTPLRPLPLVELRAWSHGRLTEETLAWGVSELLDPLEKAVKAGEDVRGVLLVLHGAMVAVGEDDPEGHVLERARRIVGPDIPIVATVDLHVHVTPRMVSESNAIVFYHEMPHVDMKETGQRAAAIMHAMLTRGAKPVSAYVKVPVHLPVERVNTLATEEQVANGQFAAFPPECKRVLRALEQEPWCLAAGLGTTQPWLNVPDLGATFVIVADDTVPGAVDKAQAKADELARQLWEARHQFMPSADSLLPAAEAVRKAHEFVQTNAKMVAIGDGADATTSGAPGDSTWLLQELMKFQWPEGRPAMVTVRSPEGVAEAVKAGVGNALTVTMGGLRDTRFAIPVTINAVVERLFDGVFTVAQGHCKGLKSNMEKCATLRILSSKDGHDTWVRVILTSGTGPHFAAELFTLAGYPPFGPGTHVSVVICKSPAGFRATYGPHAGLLMSSDAPGCAPPQFWKPEYKSEFSKIDAPLFPLDMNAELKLDARLIRSPVAH
eukprot:m.184596 g.184596  ORF g.184596 m.184596 type:complete len:553 (+) comp16182_c0_seq1:60-1718(+)